MFVFSSCRIDWFVLLSVQLTLRTLRYACISKASIFFALLLFMVQLYAAYVAAGHANVFRIRSFDSTVKVPLFHILITFL